MNIALACTMGAAGMVAGWFIPLAASKTMEFKLGKSGRTPDLNNRFTSPGLKLLCLLVNGALWAAAGIFTGNLLHAALLAVILFDAAVITIVDIRVRLIPNEAVLFMLLAGLLLQISFGGFSSVLAAVITATTVMVVFIAMGSIMGFDAIGAGDVKLAGAMGLILSFPGIIYALVLMSVVILAWCFIGLVTRKLKLKSKIAFAPFLMAGTAFAIVINITR